VVSFFSFGRGGGREARSDRNAAELRAQELLRCWLSPQQRAQYDTRGSFEVVGSDTGRRYRICKGSIFNIQELDADGIQVRAWCVTADRIATGDVNLSQKIALENFESEVLMIANRSEGAVWPANAASAGGRSWVNWR
jgi:hypothetical protein